MNYVASDLYYVAFEMKYVAFEPYYVASDLYYAVILENIYKNTTALPCFEE